MSCSPIHLKDYVLHELADPERHQLEAHLKTCPACREELDGLRLTQAALFSLRDEEIPQRIAFVSDPVFEPSPIRRWWTGFWNAPARLTFAAAALLSAAIVYSAVTRPTVASQPVQQPVVATGRDTQASTPAPLSDAEIQKRVDAAVARAVSANQAAQTEQVKQTMAEMEDYRRQLKLAAAQLDWSVRRADNLRYVSNNYGPPARTAAGEEK